MNRRPAPTAGGGLEAAPARLLTPRVQAARLLCTITFHFVERRLGFLAEVLRGLAEFDVAGLDVVVVTNTARPDELGRLRRLCAESLGGRARVRSFPDLDHPWHLTWCHKTILTEEFLGAAQRHTHFLYLEDDIRLSFGNFCYFVEYREVLRARGLLPAFVRTEFSAPLGGLVASDAFWPVHVPVQPHLFVGDWVFVNMPNPYNPCFILDRALAESYVASPSFDRERSFGVCLWGVRERAALGLCLEDVPPGFHSRYVVPVARDGGALPSVARIDHLPANYANDPGSPLGKVRLDSLFTGVGELTPEGGWAPQAEPAGTAAGREGRFHLVTHHDTLVYLDEHLKLLRQAPFGSARPNLVLALDGGGGHLLLHGPSTGQDVPLSLATATGEVALGVPAAAGRYAVEVFGDGRIALRAGERLLSAPFDDVVRRDAEGLSEWECFGLVRADTLAGLDLLRRHCWLSPADRRILTLAPQPFDFGRDPPAESSALAATLAPGSAEGRREMAFGPARLSLVGTAPVLRWEAGDPPGRLAVIDRAGRAHDFLRFAPLVRYEVHGDDSCYARLRRSLESLARSARYDGAIALVCDRPAAEALGWVPESLRGRVRFADDGRHQPVLRCTADSVFDGDVTDLLIDLLIAGGEGGPDAVEACRRPVAAGRPAPSTTLAGLASRVPARGCAVLVGGAAGRAALAAAATHLAAHMPADATLYGLADGLSDILESVAAAAPDGATVIALPGGRAAALGWRRPIDLLHLVGLHRHPALRETLAFWLARLRPGGGLSGDRDPDGSPALDDEIDRLGSVLGTAVRRDGPLWWVTVPGAPRPGPKKIAHPP